jgi:prepilin-type processing-associated H-X9-DG protein
MNNTHQLTIAWVMYAHDYNDKMVINNHGGAARGGADTTAWIAGWLDWTGSADNTDTRFLINDTWAKLSGYTGHSAKVYKCPADVFRSQANPPGDRVRSVSMNAAVGEGWGDAAHNSPKETFFGGTFYVAKKMADLVKPKPDMVWVLVDEHPDSINDGCFFDDPLTRSQWTDLPACYHNGACGFSFADGHSEIRKWKTEIKSAPVRYLDYGNQYAHYSAGPPYTDYDWIAARIPIKP